MARKRGPYLPLGKVLDTGFIIRPDGLPKARGGADVAVWRCPRCRRQLWATVDECVSCNSELVDPDVLERREAALVG